MSRGVSRMIPRRNGRIRNGLVKGSPTKKTAVSKVESEDDVSPFSSITKALSPRNSSPTPNFQQGVLYTNHGLHFEMDSS